MPRRRQETASTTSGSGVIASPAPTSKTLAPGLVSPGCIELFPVGPYHHDWRATRDGVVVGYAALPQHAFDAGLAALGELL